MKSKIKEVRFAAGAPNQGIPESLVVTLKNDWILDIHIDFQLSCLTCSLLTGNNKSGGSNKLSRTCTMPAPIKVHSVFDIYYAILAFMYKLGIEKPSDTLDDAIYGACCEYKNYIGKYNLVNTRKVKNKWYLYVWERIQSTCKSIKKNKKKVICGLIDHIWLFNIIRWVFLCIFAQYARLYTEWRKRFYDSFNPSPKIFPLGHLFHRLCWYLRLLWLLYHVIYYRLI